MISESYSEGRISLWKAAGKAGITYRAALEELKIRNIPFRYEKEDLDVDIQWALQEK
jgi:predicted HTH domain antitoxin